VVAELAVVAVVVVREAAVPARRGGAGRGGRSAGVDLVVTELVRAGVALVVLEAERGA
jgi:hypothetical protein